VLPAANALWVSSDQLRARLKLRAAGAIESSRGRNDVQRAACKGYMDSYLDEHGITLRLEFYRDDGPMAGTMTLSPRVCSVTAPKTA
jgi:hypothetical protein